MIGELTGWGKSVVQFTKDHPTAATLCGVSLVTATLAACVFSEIMGAADMGNLVEKIDFFGPHSKKVNPRCVVCVVYAGVSVFTAILAKATTVMDQVVKPKQD